MVEDAQRDTRFADHPFVTGEPWFRFYAGCPLVTPDGHALGTLCVIDHQPRRLRAEHERALRVLSHHAMTLLESHRRTREVTQLSTHIDEDLGYRVLTAPDGARSLEVWAGHDEPIDLLPTDMVMPHGVNGRELAERLRRERPDLRVLFVSGYSTDTAVLRQSLGARFALLQKPYTRTRLAQAVRACLDAPS